MYMIICGLAELTTVGSNINKGDNLGLFLSILHGYWYISAQLREQEIQFLILYCGFIDEGFLSI